MCIDRANEVNIHHILQSLRGVLVSRVPTQQCIYISYMILEKLMYITCCERVANAYNSVMYIVTECGRSTYLIT